MKSFVTIIGLMLISCAGVAQSSATFKPGYPYNCEEHKKVMEPVTRVLNVTTHETADLLDVEFDTELLVCKEATYIPQDIAQYTSFTFFNEKHVFDQYEPSYTVTPKAFSVNHVAIEFKKAKVFKGNSDIQQAEFSYKMETEAARRYVPRYGQVWDFARLGRIYPWYIQMTYVSATDTTTVVINPK